MNYTNHNTNNQAENKIENQMRTLLFWNVDTQYDFMRSDESFNGALPVAGARAIENNLEKLTSIAKDYNIKVINTADWHTLDDAEINDSNPDYKKTYPQHCMACTIGAQYVPAANPEQPYIIPSLDTGDFDEAKVLSNRNIVLHKSRFDAFVGNEHTDWVINLLRPKTVFVYGVATNVCVNYAVRGLLERKCDVYVVTDAIKELPEEISETPLETVIDSWKDIAVKYNQNVNFVKTEDVTRLVRKQEYKILLDWLKNEKAQI